MSQETKFRWSASELRQLTQIAIIFVAACIETDMYLPAFPDMMKTFQVSEAQIQGVLTWNFIGLCLSGPLYGPLSDSTGRRKPLLFALGLFLIGSFFTVIAGDFSELIFGRVLQGLGSGGCFSLGSAILFDSFSTTKALIGLNVLNTITPLAMALAPLVGGILNQHFGFQANFLAILIVVLMSWGVTLVSFKETLPASKRSPLNLKKVSQDFGRALRSLTFWQLNLPLCLFFGVYLAFLSISAVLFVGELGISKSAYPWFQVVVLSGWLLGSLLSTPLLHRGGPTLAKKLGIVILGLSVAAFQLTCWLSPQNPYLLTFFMMTYSFGYNWLQTPYFGEIMELMPDIKGVLGSLITSLRLLLTALVVTLVGEFYDKSIASFSFALWGIIAIAGPMIWLRERGSHKRPQSVVSSEATVILH